MDDDSKKIEQLITSKNAQNNAIAIHLMLEVLNLSFKEAFSKLLLNKERFSTYFIEIGLIKISYFHDHHVMFDYIYIRRTIYYNRQELKDWTNEIYDAETAEHQGIYAGLNTNEEQAILTDLQTIAPFIETLFRKND